MGSKVVAPFKLVWGFLVKVRKALNQEQATKDKAFREALDQWHGTANSLRALHENMWSCLTHFDDERENDGIYWDGQPYDVMWSNLDPMTNIYKKARVKLLALDPKPELVGRVNGVHDRLLDSRPISPSLMSMTNLSKTAAGYLPELADMEHEIDAIAIKGNK